MMTMDIRIGNRIIGRVEITNGWRKKNGNCEYEVVVKRDEARIEMKVEHKRTDGAFKLMERVCRKASKLLDEYYSYPEDKVEHGVIRGSDIPERYRNEFGKFFGVGTVSMLPRRCPEGCLDVDKLEDKEVAYNIGDLENFLDNRRWGKAKIFD